MKWDPQSEILLMVLSAPVLAEHFSLCCTPRLCSRWRNHQLPPEGQKPTSGDAVSFQSLLNVLQTQEKVLWIPPLSQMPPPPNPGVEIASPWPGCCPCCVHGSGCPGCGQRESSPGGHCWWAMPVLAATSWLQPCQHKVNAHSHVWFSPSVLFSQV